MSLFEFFDENGDTGMLVGGSISIDKNFRDAADADGRPDARLITIESDDEMFDKEALRLAAIGQLAVESAPDTDN